MPRGVNIDIEQPGQLARYLHERGYVSEAQEVSVSILPGGVSNRTVLAEVGRGEAWVIKQPLTKLRVDGNWYCQPERIHREALGLRYLETLAPRGAVTRFIFEDEHYHLLGMSAVPHPHDNWKTLLLAGALHDDHVDQFARLLATIHRRSAERADELSALFADQSFFAALRVEPYYSYTARQEPEAAVFIETLISQMTGRRFALVHGDYSPKNVLISAGRLILLDHEVIHWGDPAFDLGFSLTHLLSKAHYLPRLRAALGEAARGYWHLYRETLGEMAWTHDLDFFTVRHTLACLLARVRGRSPLEYLSEEMRARQRSVVRALMAAVPLSVDEMIDDFLEGLERDDRY